MDGLGLLDYHARFYDAYLNQWTQSDTVIPQPDNPQSLNRYMYTLGNPIRYNDPTGHCPICIVAVLLIGAVMLTGDTTRLGAGDAENFFDLLAAGIQHDSHANIIGAGLKSLQDDPSVQAAQGRIVNIIKKNPEYEQQSYSNNNVSDQFTANGGMPWKEAAITFYQPFWMVHSGQISATNTKVSADGTISTTWNIHDTFDFIPGPNHSDEYNKIAAPVHFLYNDVFHAEESYPTDAHWNQTIPPSNSCGHCR